MVKARIGEDQGKRLDSPATELSNALENSRDALIGSELLAKERIKKARQKIQKDYHIRLRQKNSNTPGRGKNSFVIRPETFRRIIDFIEENGGYKRAEVVDVLTQMYFEGLSFRTIETKLGSDTVVRHLRMAFSALCIDLGSWKKPSLKTLTFSRALLVDAEIANVDLTEKFYVV